jgi:predicted PurR-regulated permease PerM
MSTARRLTSGARITPGARARRALLVDSVAALLVALIALQLTAGLGVVAFFGLPVLLAGLVWIGVERLVRRIRLRRRRRRAR